MGERALGIGLFLLSIALYVGPLFIAFAANGWDLEATVMPRQEELDAVEDRVENILGAEFSERTLNLVSSTVTPTEIRATINFVSPFNVDIKITEISGEMSCEEHHVSFGSVHIEEGEVDIPAYGTVSFHLVGTLTPGGYQHIEDFHGGDLPDFTITDGVFEMESYGVTLRAEVEKMEWN